MQWSNVLQFLDTGTSSFVVGGTSQAALIEEDLPNLPLFGSFVTSSSSDAASAAPEQVTLPDAAEDELSLLDPDLEPLVRSVMALGAQDFVAGHEVDGQPLEAAWPDRRVAVLLDGQAAPDGWQARSVTEWTTDTLLHALKEQN